MGLLSLRQRLRNGVAENSIIILGYEYRKSVGKKFCAELYKTQHTQNFNRIGTEKSEQNYRNSLSNIKEHSLEYCTPIRDAFGK